MAFFSFITDLFTNRKKRPMQSPIVINHVDKVDVHITVNNEVDIQPILDKLDKIITSGINEEAIKQATQKLDTSNEGLKKAVEDHKI